MVQAVISTVVVGLQTRPIASTPATNGQALVWNGASWAPAGPYLPIAGGVTTGPVIIPAGSTAFRNFTMQADISGAGAAAGIVGESPGGPGVNGGPFTLAHATWGTPVSMTLQPGDWDIWGLVNHNPSVGDCIQFYSNISTTPNGFGPLTASITGQGMGNTSLFAPILPVRIVAATAYYLNTYHFSISSATAQITGTIYARRAC
jgi:hypothetical protein